MAQEDNEEKKGLSTWAKHMLTFVGSEVEVIHEISGQALSTKGMLRYFNFSKDSVLLETKEELIWIRTPIKIVKTH